MKKYYLAALFIIFAGCGSDDNQDDIPGYYIEGAKLVEEMEDGDIGYINKYSLSIDKNYKAWIRKTSPIHESSSMGHNLRIKKNNYYYDLTIPIDFNDKWRRHSVYEKWYYKIGRIEIEKKMPYM